MRPLIIVLATLAAAKDLQKLIRQMTLDEKLGLLHGAPPDLLPRGVGRLLPAGSVQDVEVDEEHGAGLAHRAVLLGAEGLAALLKDVVAQQPHSRAERRPVRESATGRCGEGQRLWGRASRSQSAGSSGCAA